MILLEIYNPKKKLSEWHEGFVINKFRSGNNGEDFYRYDVKLNDGRTFHSCHPDCVKEAPSKVN